MSSSCWSANCPSSRATGTGVSGPGCAP
jgi:hypothetical protein